MDIREQLKIRRDTLSTLETESTVTQEMIDDAYVLANFSRRSSDQSKYSQLRRRFEYQKDVEEAKKPQPEVEPVTKEQVAEAVKKAKESPTIENLAVHSKLKRRYVAQEDAKEADRLAKMPKYDPVAEAEAAQAAEAAAKLKYAEGLQEQRKQRIEAKTATFMRTNH
ncbi:MULTISPECIES: hypothetical protein [Exiguobacterium]|uniref:hypothetical protein n=1 Tax=Exiguobacterium TaxID=33986 RepID=UPI001BEB1B3F|nr:MULTISPECIES: hypothetical protein [Exiguobacterium]MCT4792846.1 hypothetical protein [Exiguobacterium artemiae]